MTGTVHRPNGHGLSVEAGRSRQAALAKAAVLVEALPWLQRFRDTVVVLKYGGHAMTEPALSRAFAEDVAFLHYAGLRPVVVHGGGPQITAHLERLGIHSEFRAGQRVTTPEAMEVVRMVLVGQVNGDVVRLVNDHGSLAVGLSGEDGGLFTAERRTARVAGEDVDLGMVGDIVSVDAGTVHALLADGRIPVVASVARGRDGATYNVNADTAAAALAVALQAHKLVMLTDVEGLYAHWPPIGEPGSTEADVISEITATDLARLLPGLDAGMVPKMEACLRAVRGGVPQAHVLDGRLPHGVLLEVVTDAGIGTMVMPDPPSPAPRLSDGPADAGAEPGGVDVARPPSSPSPSAGSSPSGDATAGLAARWDAVMMPNYGTPAVALARGRGSRVWDVDGREYLDLIAGIAVSSLGHGHAALVRAVSEQVSTLAHTSNLVMHERGVQLAERLLRLLRADGRVFLSNDGATANEAAYKLARRHGWLADPSGGRLEIVAAEGGFHGRTLGALSITGTKAKRAPFEPLPGPVRFVPYGDADALRAAVTERTAAVFLEPTLGEGGVVPPPAGYLRAAREACDAAGALLVIDEIQSGIGRTGTWFAVQHDGVMPDVLTLAKGLGGGMPIGACIGIGAAGRLFGRGDHGSTFGGNPVSCAAALAVLDTIEQDGLLEHVVRLGARLAAGLDQIDHRALQGVRGSGLWLALALTDPIAATVEAAARDAGFLVNAVLPNAVRLAPPLVLTEDEADSFVAALPHILDRSVGPAIVTAGDTAPAVAPVTTVAGSGPPAARPAQRSASEASAD
jgi:acetylornithine aminotransferase